MLAGARTKLQIARTGTHQRPRPERVRGGGAGALEGYACSA